MKTTEEIVYSDNLKKLDEILVGGLRVVVVTNRVNNHGHRVLVCGIVGAQTVKRNQLTVIIPDKTPVITYY